MKCTQCGGTLAAGGRFCAGCGARRPEMPARFEQTERQYLDLKAQLESGQISRQAYQDGLKQLVFKDDTGDFWMLGADSGIWYRHDGRQWVQQDPPLQGQSSTSSAAATPATSATPSGGHSGLPVTWLVGGLGCAAVVVVLLVAVGLLFVLPSARQSGTSPSVEEAALPPEVVPLTEAVAPTVVPAAATRTPAPTTTPQPTYTAAPTVARVADTPTPQPSPTAVPPTTAPPTATAAAPDSPAQVTINKIAFVSDRDGQKEIYVMNADGGNQIRLTNNPAEDTLPAWSPDGRQIVFVSDRDGNPELYVMDAAGGNQIRLTDNPSPDYDPAWSPDGRQIVFDTERDVQLRTDVWVMNPDGSGAHIVQPFGRNPAWSPDGSRLVALFRFESLVHLGVMPADGSAAPVPLLQSGMNNFPAWSPDGSRIVFDTAGAAGTSDIAVINADGSNLINLTNSREILNVTPGWSPDGQRLVLASDRDGDYEIYVMNADGSGLSQLTDNQAWDLYPAWR